MKRPTPGQVMKAARAAHRPELTQADVAKRLDVSQPMVAKWESDEASPRTDKIRDVADAYGVEPEALLP